MEVGFEWPSSYLKPMTLRPTTATICLAVCQSKDKRSGRARKMSQITKSRAAIANCDHRKKSGVSVVFRTHLLLQAPQTSMEGNISVFLHLRHDHLQSSISSKWWRTLRYRSTYCKGGYQIKEHDARLSSRSLVSCQSAKRAA